MTTITMKLHSGQCHICHTCRPLHVLIVYSLLTFCLNSSFLLIKHFLEMGKYNLQKSKVVQCEPSIVNTHWGPRLVDHAIPSTPSLSSRQSSLSKKCALSLNIQYDDYDHPNEGGSGPHTPKRSWTSGMVCYPFEYTLYILLNHYSHRTIGSGNISSIDNNYCLR